MAGVALIGPHRLVITTGAHGSMADARTQSAGVRQELPAEAKVSIVLLPSELFQ
jgi:hypothetical protein